MPTDTQPNVPQGQSAIPTTPGTARRRVRHSDYVEVEVDTSVSVYLPDILERASTEALLAALATREDAHVQGDFGELAEAVYYQLRDRPSTITPQLRALIEGLTGRNLP